MDRKVKARRYGIIHYIAICKECDFFEADHVDRGHIRYLVRQHVIKTGHSVDIEAGTSTHYSLEARRP